MIRRHHFSNSGAFTLIELLVVISIIALLIGIMLPTLAAARRRSWDIKCTTNLKQISTALAVYLNEFGQVVFWRGTDSLGNEDVENLGMDSFVSGGTELGNWDQQNAVYPEGLFNHFQPRPLNPFVQSGNLGFTKVELFHCAYDQPGCYEWIAGDNRSVFQLFGNSYKFNARATPPGWAGGLAGVRFDSIKSPVKTVVFLDRALLELGPVSLWHPDLKGNVAFADGHVAFMAVPSSAPDSEYSWNP